MRTTGETTGETPTYRFVARSVDAGLLGLPWERPLAEWTCDNLVDLERGVHRHVVRFVEIDGSYYALKELPPPLANREYRLLGHLGGTSVPSVEPVGVVDQRRSARDGEALNDVLVTRYLEYSLPFRIVLGRRVLPGTEGALLEAVAGLLVRVHLAGFFWGDCSPSNILFRRDAGALAAYLVDVETGELHERLSNGQRLHDLEIARENLTLEFFDVAAEFEWTDDRDPVELAQKVLDDYERLWANLTEDEVFGLDEASALENRLRELNELGFEADEVELLRTETDYRLRLPQARVEPGYHRRRLLRLTGLNAQDNQARRLLADIRAYGAALSEAGLAPVSTAALAGRWLSEIFEPTVAAIPSELWGKRAPAETFYEILEHRARLAEREGRDVPVDEARASYVDDVLRPAPEERTALLRPRQT